MKWKQTTKLSNSFASKHSDLSWQVRTFDNLGTKVSHLESHDPFPKNRLEIEKKEGNKEKKCRK